MNPGLEELRQMVSINWVKTQAESEWLRKLE